MADFRALILQRHRHLKWKAFDWLEATLMILCGVCIFMFTLTVFCDVVTRTLGAPWLWLQQVTTAFFAWRRDLLAMIMFHAATDAWGMVITPLYTKWWA